MSDRTFDWLRILLLALAVAGLLVSGQLQKKSEGEKLSAYMEKACGGTFDCTKVLNSPYARLIQLPPYQVPVSTAAIGMAYFMFMGIWLLLVGRLPGRLHHTWLVPALAGLLGLLISAWMVYVMARILHSWCGLCLLTHVIDLLLVLGIWWLWLAGPTRRQPLAENEPGLAPPASTSLQLWKIPAMALAVAVAVGLAQLRSAQTSEALTQTIAAANQYDNLSNDDDYRKYLFSRARKVEIPIDADDPTSGPADARHTLVIFGDFQCPHCADFAELVPQIQANLPQPMRVVFKYFPLSRECNPARPAVPGADSHKVGCTAAAAAEAARRLGGDDAFWKAHDTLYRGHNLLRTTNYDKLAQSLGLDPDAFNERRNDPALLEHIRRVAQQGGKIGVRTTPAIFLDGRRIEAPWKNTFDRKQRKRTIDIPKTLLYWKNLLTWSDLAEARASRAAASQLADQDPATASTQPAATMPTRRLPRKTASRPAATGPAELVPAAPSE